jgi:hypothetical protein
MNFNHNPIPKREDWVVYPDLTCSISGMSCFEIAQLILAHLRNWHCAKSWYAGVPLDLAYRQGWFDEEVFSAAWKCAEKQLGIEIRRERRICNRYKSLGKGELT